VPLERQLNPSPAIQRVNDKRGFRLLCQENLPDITPRTFANGLPLPQDEELPEALVLRPAHHAQGRNLWYIERPTAEGLAERVRIQNALQGGWYASEYIPKVSEHRVYVANSRVVTVARKTPENPDAVAWNVAQGGRFDVVNWDGWDLGLCRNAVRVAALAETDFCGVDMMTDEDGHSWVIEANSAPSLPPLSDGRVSYRQKALMKAFQWTFDNGKQTLETPEVPENWRDVIHPAIWSR
jgi:glutathione synthase/RimK-type ligase-like ATP-grasp enzyme